MNFIFNKIRSSAKRVLALLLVVTTCCTALTSGIVFASDNANDTVTESETNSSNKVEGEYTATEDYILQNLDPSIVGEGELAEYDLIYVKQTFAEKSLMPKGDYTINGLWRDDDGDGMSDYAMAFLTQQENSIMLYQVGDSDYAVGYIDTASSDAYYLADYTFAMRNNNGEVIDDVIFDKETGLVYVPASYRQANNENDSIYYCEYEDGDITLSIGTTQAQLLYLTVVDDYEEITNEVSVNITATRVDGDIVATGTVEIPIIETSTVITIAEDEDARNSVSSDTIKSILVNGYGIGESEWEYDDGTGEISITILPSTISSVEITLKNPTLLEKIANMIKSLFIVEAEAADLSDLINYTDDEWEFSELPSAGDYFIFNSSKLGDAGSTSLTYGNESSINTEVAYKYITYTDDSVAVDANGNAGTVYLAYNQTLVDGNYDASVNMAQLIVSILENSVPSGLIRKLSSTTGSGTNISFYSALWIKKGTHTVYYNGDTSSKAEINFDAAYSYRKTEGGGVTRIGSGNYFGVSLICTHISQVSSYKGVNTSYNLVTDMPTDMNGEYYYNCAIYTKVLGVDTSENTILLAIIAPTAQSQAGAIVIKVPYVATGYLDLVKSSSNTSITKNNGCYSLKGAVYTVYSNSACTTSVGTLICKANGSTDTLELDAGTYYVKETTVPTGYKLDDTVYKVTVKSGGTNTLNVSDPPLDDPLTLDIYKVDASGNVSTPNGNASLTGTQFTLKYYDNTDGETSGTATKTWVFETQYDSTYNAYRIRFYRDSYLVTSKSDSLYYDHGYVVYPLGTYVLTETTAATGYLVEGTATTSSGTVYDAGEAYTFILKSNTAGTVVQYTNLPDSITYQDYSIYAGLSIEKQDDVAVTPQGNADLSGITFTITNNSDNPVWVAAKSVSGIILSPSSSSNTYDGVTYYGYAKGAAIGTITTAYDSSANAYVATTTNAALPIGEYIVQETATNGSYLLTDGSKYTYTIVDSDADSIVGEADNATSVVKNIVVRGGVSVQKYDYETEKAKAQGSATLEGAVFEITNLSDKAVYVTAACGISLYTENASSTKTVDGVKYYIFEPNAVIGTITTDSTGLASTSDAALPYGSYKIREIGAPEGYLLAGTFNGTYSDDLSTVYVEFDITYNGQMYEYSADSGANGKGDYDIVKRTDFSFYKIDSYGSGLSVVWQITSNTTGETHYIMTNANGAFYSKTTATMLADNSTFGTSDASYSEILWFSGYSSNGAVNTGIYGALPYDTYTLTEISYSESGVGDDNSIYNMCVYTLVVDDGTCTWYDENGNLTNREHVELPTMVNIKGTVDIYSNIHVDTVSGSQVATADVVDIVDVITYDDFNVGYSYTVEGRLVNVDSGEAVYYSDGSEAVSMIAFTCKNADGTVNLWFDGVDLAGLCGQRVVALVYAYQEIDGEVYLIASHDDMDDASETVYVTGISTTALDNKTGLHIAYACESTVITETVSVSYVTFNDYYIVVAMLADASTGECLTGTDGNYIYASKTVKASTANGFSRLYSGGTVASGNISVVFNLDASDLAGKTVVVYAYLYSASVIAGNYDVTGTLQVGELLASETDADNEDERVHFPSVVTSAYDYFTNDHVGMSEASGATVFVDTVALSSLLEGYTYKVVGTLFDENGNEYNTASSWIEVLWNYFTGKYNVASEYTFEAESSDMTVNVTFELEGVAQGTTLTAVQDLYIFNEDTGCWYIVGGAVDESDPDETVWYPDVKTSAADVYTGDHVGTVGETSVIDTVMVTNLVVGKEYTVSGVLMDRDTGVAYVDANGGEVTADKTFTATAADMEVELVFEFVSAQNTSVVVFERLYYADVLVAEHADPEDEGQSVYYPEIQTTLTDSGSGLHETLATTKTTLVDEVAYYNLIVGNAYTVSGYLVNKETGKAVKVNGEKITASKTFEAKKSDGTVKLKFVFDSSALAGETVVAFETLYHNDVEVAVHADINDESQTVYIPAVGTILVDEDTGSHSVTITSVTDTTVLVDAVKYKNFTVGEEYTVTGYLVNKETEKKIKTADGVVTESLTFTAEKKSGTVEVVFRLDPSADGLDLSGVTVVAFETVCHGETVVAEHKDINDTKQSVKFESETASDVPKTGDGSNYYIWLAVSVLCGFLFLAGGCLAFAFWRRKRKAAHETHGDKQE